MRSKILSPAFKIEILHNKHHKMSFLFRDCCGFCICYHIFVYCSCDDYDMEYTHYLYIIPCLERRSHRADVNFLA